MVNSHLITDEELDQGIADFTEVMRLNGNFPRVRYQRGKAYLMRGKYKEALPDLSEAIRENPKDAEAIAERAVLYGRMGDYAKAIADAKQVVHLTPRSASGHGILARVLACCPEAKYRDGKQALKHAREACKLTDWKHRSALSALAAAHAELGQFDEAVKWQTKAIELASSRITKELEEKRLALYKDRKALRMRGTEEYGESVKAQGSKKE